MNAIVLAMVLTSADAVLEVKNLNDSFPFVVYCTDGKEFTYFNSGDGQAQKNVPRPGKYTIYTSSFGYGVEFGAFPPYSTVLEFARNGEKFKPDLLPDGRWQVSLAKGDQLVVTPTKQKIEPHARVIDLPGQKVMLYMMRPVANYGFDPLQNEYHFSEYPNSALALFDQGEDLEVKRLSNSIHRQFFMDRNGILPLSESFEHKAVGLVLGPTTKPKPVEWHSWTEQKIEVMLKKEITALLDQNGGVLRKEVYEKAPKLGHQLRHYQLNYDLKRWELQSERNSKKNR